MCGIAGWIDYEGRAGRNQEILNKMSYTLRNRGPDAAGGYLDECAALLHRRLAVIDPENGAQPMVYEDIDNEWVLCYNGELYNAGELRKELISLGHGFQGLCDTEVLLHAYAQWGEECLDRLNGIYAFAVYEPRKERLFLARDRMGVKPLFFHAYPGGLVFGSEIKTLLENPMVSRRVGREGIAQVLLLGPGRVPGITPFEDIKELEPGQFARFSRQGLEIKQYWSLQAAPHTDSPEETREKIRELVTDAVQRQMVSDVPIATFLSGGLDSSIISALAAKLFQEEGRGPLTTYSVDYTDNSRYFRPNAFQPNSDEYYIGSMVEAIGSRHKNVVLENRDTALALDEAVLARDLPGMADVDSSLLLFCREVRKEHTVAVSGECADEIFGGYPWFHREDIRNQDGFPWSGNTGMKAELLRPGLLNFDARDYVHSNYQETVAAVSKLEGESPEDARIREMTTLNMRWFMQTLLDRKDRMSMANSLEVRVPFCDHRVAEYAYNIPWVLKSWQGREKGLLRKAFEGLLPHEVVHRKKSPYPKTHNPEYLHAVREMLINAVKDKNAPLLALLDRDKLQNLIETDASGFTTPWYGQLMTGPQILAYLYQINHWMLAYKVELNI